MADQIKRVIDEAYAKGLTSKRRVLIELDKYLNIAIVTVTIGNRTDIRHFLDGQEIYVAWLDPEDRRRWVGSMKAEGFRGRRIAAFLNVSSTTIYNDLKFMRESGTGLLNLTRADKLTSMTDIRARKPKLSNVAMH